MKKTFILTQEINRNDGGFILPYILLIAFIVIICVTGSISVYRNHNEMTQYLEEQLKIDTLFQMSKEHFKSDIRNEMIDLKQSGQTIYRFPYGNVTVQYQPLDVHKLSVQHHIVSDTGARYATNTNINY